MDLGSMSSQAIPPNTEAAILARMLDSRKDDVAPEVARYLLSFQFPNNDIERMNELAANASRGALSPEELTELESYLHVSNLLGLMQSRAALQAGQPK
jgi:hypothetical protein